MANKKKKSDVPMPRKDIRIEPGGIGFKDALANFVKKTSMKPKK